VLVVDAMTGQDAVNSAKAFHEKLALTGVILTKLDGDARGGAAVSLKAVTGKPILFVGMGEKIDDLDAFHPDRMAGRILGMGDVVGLVERAQTAISEKDAQANFEKMVMGNFTLEDMLAQLRMIRKLGPMKKVLGMMPGMSGIADTVNIDDKQMNRLEALFTSMTRASASSPTSSTWPPPPHRARRGPGTRAVNDPLKRFKEMKLMMRQMQKLGLGAKSAPGSGPRSRRCRARASSPTRPRTCRGRLRARARADRNGLGGDSGLSGLFGGRPPRPMGPRRRGRAAASARTRRSAKAAVELRGPALQPAPDRVSCSPLNLRNRSPTYPWPSSSAFAARSQEPPCPDHRHRRASRDGRLLETLALRSAPKDPATRVQVDLERAKH
jgi:hypothetical protein